MDLFCFSFFVCLLFCVFCGFLLLLLLLLLFVQNYTLNFETVLARIFKVLYEDVDGDLFSITDLAITKILYQRVPI